MFLNIKRIVYKYTGLYLAHKEELEYVTSSDFCKKMSKILAKKDNDMSLRDVQGLLIGLWQADKGFTRPMSRVKFKRSYRLFWNIIAWVDELYITIKWDVQDLYRAIKKKL